MSATVTHGVAVYTAAATDAGWGPLDALAALSRHSRHQPGRTTRRIVQLEPRSTPHRISPTSWSQSNLCRLSASGPWNQSVVRVDPTIAPFRSKSRGHLSRVHSGHLVPCNLSLHGFCKNPPTGTAAHIASARFRGGYITRVLGQSTGGFPGSVCHIEYYVSGGPAHCAS